MTYAEAVEITKALPESSAQELNSALAFFRAVIAQKGSYICVFERGRCENILIELDRRSKAPNTGEPASKAELIAHIESLDEDSRNRTAAMVQMAEALQSALNLGQLVHFARVSNPQVGPDDGEYEMQKIRLAIADVSKSFPLLFT